MRLFLAAMLPPDIQQTLGRIRVALDWLPVKGNWQAAENLHISLKFLGEIPDGRVAPICDAVGNAVATMGPLNLCPSGLAFLPPSRDARVLAADFTGDIPRLTTIAQALEAACEGCGIPREARPYVPHATLARFRDGLRAVHRPRIEQSCASLFAHMSDFALNEIQLMQSTLSSAGSRYNIAARWPI